MALGILTQFLRGGRSVPRTGIKILNSKRGPRNFYKGKGCKSTGRHTSKGGYVLMDEKLPKYVVPDLTNCKVEFVARMRVFKEHSDVGIGVVMGVFKALGLEEETFLPYVAHDTPKLAVSKEKTGS